MRLEMNRKFEKMMESMHDLPKPSLKRDPNYLLPKMPFTSAAQVLALEKQVLDHSFRDQLVCNFYICNL